MRKTINQIPFWYCLLDKTTEPIVVIDERGHETGESILQYMEAVEMNANISPASGQSQSEMFGGIEDYDRVIVTTDMSCPIDESTVLFIDKEPEWSEVETYETESTGSDALYADDSLVRKTYRVPANDYIVKRVAKSLNNISIAVRKVNVR